MAASSAQAASCGCSSRLASARVAPSAPASSDAAIARSDARDQNGYIPSGLLAQLNGGTIMNTRAYNTFSEGYSSSLALAQVPKKITFPRECYCCYCCSPVTSRCWVCCCFDAALTTLRFTLSALGREILPQLALAKLGRDDRAVVCIVLAVCWQDYKCIIRQKRVCLRLDLRFICLRAPEGYEHN
jgi:hypothetical protein